jgi:hypothetical protein
MSDYKLMINTLRQGKTGAEILQILDAITENSVESVMQTVEAVGNTISATLDDKELVCTSYSKEPTTDWIDF